MPFRRVIFLIVAIGLSFATTMVVRDWVAAVRLEAAKPTTRLAATEASDAAISREPASASSSPTPLSTRDVLVAARALPAGHVLADDDMQWQARPEGDLSRSSISRSGDGADGLPGAIVREPIAAGEPITAERIVRLGARGFLAAALTPGRRAITVAIAASSPLNGLISPGDRVDVIAVAIADASAGQRKPKPTVGETLLRDVKLLAVDQRLDGQRPNGQPSDSQPSDERPGDVAEPHTATLEVTPKQAEMIAAAADHFKLSLSLRNNTLPEASDDEPGPLAWDGAAPETVEPLAPPLRTEAVTGAKVSIIRGGDVSERDFKRSPK
jgi:pilus assembly protein CpaB